MTIEELQERQSWSLFQKIDHSVGSIESFISRTQKIPYVSFSGGKDSTVLLDICRRFVNKNIKAVFVNTGNEYPEIVKFVRSTDNVSIITPNVSIREVIEKIGFPLISKEVAKGIWDAKKTKSEKLLRIRLFGTYSSKGYVSGKIPNKWQFLIREPFMISDKCCYYLKKKPLKEYQRKTGEVPIIGTLAEESNARRQQYIRRGGCNSFKENHIASYPLSIWTEQDIHSYIQHFNLAICELYKNPNCKRTGCMFCGFGAHLGQQNRFDLLYELHPNIYKAIMNYSNNGFTYREALHKLHILLPDDPKTLDIPFSWLQ